MDTTIPRKVLPIVALVLVLLAGLGIYQGLRRSSGGGDTEGDNGLPTLTAPVSGAKTASALTDPSVGGLNEAQVREIARQEAHAALGQPRTAPVAASSQDDDTPAPAAPAAKPATAAPATGTTSPRPAPTGPALQTPATPAPAEGGGQAPLF